MSDRISGSLGIRLSTELGTVSTKASAGSGNASFGALLNITGTRQLQVLAVTSERITKAAPNGGPCDPKRTSYVVLSLSRPVETDHGHVQRNRISRILGYQVSIVRPLLFSENPDLLQVWCRLRACGVYPPTPRHSCAQYATPAGWV